MTEKDLTQTMELDEDRKTAKMVHTMGHTFAEAYASQSLVELADAPRGKEKDEIRYPEDDLTLTELQRLQFEDEEEFSRVPSCASADDEWNPTLTRKS